MAESSAAFPGPEPWANGPELNLDFTSVFINSFNQQHGLVKHQISSVNALQADAIPEILEKGFTITSNMPASEINKGIKTINFTVKMRNVHMKPPMTSTPLSGKSKPMYPNEACKNNDTYSGNIIVDIDAETSALMVDESGKLGETKTRKEYKAGEILALYPIMVGSNLCNTRNLTREEKLRLGEDPDDPGCYYVIKGTEWTVDSLDNIVINQERYFKEDFRKEVARASIISKPGDGFENSQQTIIRIMNNGEITIEIPMLSKSQEPIRVPFFLVYRAMGMTTDREIAETILYDLEDTGEVSRYTSNMLNNAFQIVSDKEFENLINEHEIEPIIRAFYNKLHYVTEASYELNTESYLVQTILTRLDTKLLPGIGMDESSRIAKLRQLGSMINKLIKVEMGIIEPTDRDSYVNKRVHAAGISLAKATKMQYNTIVQQIKRKLEKAFEQTRWDAVDMINVITSSISSTDLERYIIQSITTGNKTITSGQRTAPNRLSSGMLQRKNIANVYSTHRTINAPNPPVNKNERSDQTRRVHPTMVGYICVSQTPDGGDKIGMTKQMALTCQLTESTSSVFLEMMLLRDPLMTPLEKLVLSDIPRKNLCKVFLNGRWLGCVERFSEILNKYKGMRRRDELNLETTIQWHRETNEVHFWTDAGRLTRPLLIVYSNIEEYKRAAIDVTKGVKGAKRIKFKQWTRMTSEVIRKLTSGEWNFNKLIDEGIYEYVSQVENTNCYLAPSYTHFYKYHDDICHQFTHCDNEVCILGYIAAASPGADHTAPIRTSYSCAQTKQGCDESSKNQKERNDSRTCQVKYREKSIVGSISDMYIPAPGTNCIIAIACTDGYNQEDSIIINKGAVDRGLHAVNYFRSERAGFEKTDVRRNPDIKTTTDIKNGVSYEHLVNGIVQPDTIVNKNDVLIGKVVKNPKKDEKYPYADKSVVYKYAEPARVIRTMQNISSDGLLYERVNMVSYRPMQLGDKNSSRAGCKSIAAEILPSSDMITLEDGTPVTMILNAHAVPTRMIFGQELESLRGLVAAHKGAIVDGTPFTHVDKEAVNAEAMKLGYKSWGTHKAYCGSTSTPLDVHVFAGPVKYRRLMKFGRDESHVMAFGPTCATTHQNLAGRARNGGLRLGEMEVLLMVSHGAIRTLYQKFVHDADGYTAYMCRGCGRNAIVNRTYNIYRCTVCEHNADIVAVPTTWATMVFYHEINAMNVGVRFGLKPVTFYQLR